MKIPKAKEILNDLALTGEVNLNQDDVDAIKLGKEALNQIQQIRAYAKSLFLSLLPGETKD